MYVCVENSFSDGGVHSLSVATAVARALQLCEVRLGRSILYSYSKYKQFFVKKKLLRMVHK